MAEQSFGFTVRQKAARYYSEGRWHEGGMGWVVHLPHSCDTWDIAGSLGEDGEPHATAVAALERFIAEAQVALAALRAEREITQEERHG